MNQSEFEAELLHENYGIYYGGMRPDQVNPQHEHDWDTWFLVIGGEVTIVQGDKAETFRAGERCMVPARSPHAERAGPRGLAYIAGRKSA